MSDLSVRCKVLPGGMVLLMLLAAIGFSPAVVAGAVIGADLATALDAAAGGEGIPVIFRMADGRDIDARLRAVRGDRRRTGKLHREERVALFGELKENAANMQQQLVERLRQGNKKFRSLWINNSVAVTLAKEEIQALVNLPGIETIELDHSFIRPQATLQDGEEAVDNIAAINVPRLWELGLDGRGITIAVLDTGTDVFHADLKNSWRGGGNSWFNAITAFCGTGIASCGACDQNELTPCDALLDGVVHGTSVASIIVGGSAGGSAIGVAPAARWIAAKVFSDTGVGFSSAMHAAFQWALDPDEVPETDDAPDFINNSWGLPYPGWYDAEYRTDVQLLKAAGIGLIFAAGNQGPDPSTDSSPANYPETLAIGSVGNNGDPAFTSSRGPSSYDGSIFPDLVAPGLLVRVAHTTQNGLDPLSYTYLSGTSFSAPHVSGILALLKEAFPETGVSGLEESLRGGALDLGFAGPDNQFGDGLVDAEASYLQLLQQRLAAGTPGAPVPVSPPDGAIRSAPVTFSWNMDNDFGDANIYFYLSENVDFSGTNPVVVRAENSAKTFDGGAGAAICVCFGVACLRRRKRLSLASLLVALILMLHTSCGGNGHNSGNTAGGDVTWDFRTLNHTVEDLDPGTLYYWKVAIVTQDGQRAESVTSIVTTQ